MALEYIFAQGGENATIYLTVRDGNGNAVTGLTSGSAGADLQYIRPLDASPTDVALSDLGSVDASHSDGGMIEVDATAVPGLYRFDLPDTALNRGENFVVVKVEFDASAAIYGLLSLDPKPSVVQGNVNDTGATATSFVTDLAGGADDIYNDMFLMLPDRPEVSPITDWDDGTKAITVDALSSAPADGDPIVLIDR